MRTVYLDNNATTAVAPEVREAMEPYFTAEYFNPSSTYDRASPAAQAIKRGRETLARFLGGVDPSEILFTSCATESLNTALYGAVRANPGRRHVVTTAVEHPAVYEVCKDLARSGLEVTFLPVDRAGNLDLRTFIQALRPDTLIAAVMHANNETGVIFPIDQLARITKETDPAILFLTDATQTAGKLPLDLRGALAHVDLLAFSGHKLYAPKGVGALFVRRGTPIRPFMIGGHQEGGRRAGTENVPYIAALTRAVELAQTDHEAVEARIRQLRDRLEAGLLARIPCVEVNGRGAPRIPNTCNLSVHFIEGRGDALPAQRARHLRLLGIGLHLGVAGAVPRPAGHAGALHRRPRLDPPVPGSVQHRRGRGPTPWRCSRASSPISGGSPRTGTKLTSGPGPRPRP